MNDPRDLREELIQDGSVAAYTHFMGRPATAPDYWGAMIGAVLDALPPDTLLAFAWGALSDTERDTVIGKGAMGNVAVTGGRMTYLTAERNARAVLTAALGLSGSDKG